MPKVARDMSTVCDIETKRSFIFCTYKQSYIKKRPRFFKFLIDSYKKTKKVMVTGREEFISSLLLNSSEERREEKRLDGYHTMTWEFG